MRQSLERHFVVNAIPPTNAPANDFETWLKPDVMRLIHVESLYLARQLRCPHFDRDDIEQEILLDLWKRWKRFDLARSQPQTFVDRVVRHKVVELARFYGRKKRGSGVRVFSLDQQVECLHGDSRSNRNAPQGLFEHAIEDRIDLSADVTAIINDLPDHLRMLCEQLGKNSLRVVRRQLGLSKHALQQEVIELRDRFSADGVHDNS
jgi:DNA-directed RNA polymerase specialized sigma24 family protein